MGKAVTTMPKNKRWTRVKWMAPLAAVAVVGIAYASGLLGLGWAKLMASLFPSDEALLAYVPNDVVGFAVISPHQVDLDALGAAQGAVRSAIESRIRDVKKVTGIDLASDVDKLVVSPALVVGRGRFDGAGLAARLAEYRYTKTEHKGIGYLVRQGADAIAVLGDTILLYGDEESIKRSIDAKESGASMEKDEKVTSRLDRTGWDHPLIVTVRLADDKPSLRDMLAGSNGPRAVTVGVKTQNGADIRVGIEASTPSAAEELKKTLDERRASPDSLTAMIGTGAVQQQLADLAKAATTAVEPGSSTLIVRAHASQAILEEAAQAMGKHESSIAAGYKAFKLWQLLGPVSQTPASTSSNAQPPPAFSAAPEAPASTSVLEPPAPTDTPAPSGSTAPSQAPATTAPPQAPASP